MKLNKELIKKLEDITMTDYSFTDTGETDKWDIIVEDLIREFEDLEKEYNDYKEREITKYDIEY